MRSLFIVTPLLVLTACSGSGAYDADAEDVGLISLEVTAGPPDAACLRVTVAGAGQALAVRNLTLTPGAATSATLNGLPVGAVTVRGDAFSTACSNVSSSSVPVWLSPPVSTTLVSGTPVPVLLLMQRPGRISVSVDWAAAPSTVAAPLDGFLYKQHCERATGEASVCLSNPSTGICPPQNTSDPALSGYLAVDRTVTLGGTPGTSYSITLHVQGEVEAKTYVGGTDANSTATSPAADGFKAGGTPTAADAYNVYLLRVTNPGAGGTVTNYYLNSLNPPGVSNHTTYGIDYTATIQAQGGATVRLVAADSNCSMIKNCGPNFNGASCAAPIVLANVEPTAVAANPMFDFSSAYDGQWIVLTVKNVTSP